MAISKANACFGADTIRFAPALDGTPLVLDLPPTESFPCVACLTNGLIVTEDLTIAGNGADKTFIQQDPANRKGFIFAVWGNNRCGFELRPARSHFNRRAAGHRDERPRW